MHTLHAHNRSQQADNVATGCLARLLLLLEQAGGTLSIACGRHPAVCCRGSTMCAVGDEGADADCVDVTVHLTQSCRR
jgi:hypothetical protein